MLFDTPVYGNFTEALGPALIEQLNRLRLSPKAGTTPRGVMLEEHRVQSKRMKLPGKSEQCLIDTTKPWGSIIPMMQVLPNHDPFGG